MKIQYLFILACLTILCAAITEQAEAQQESGYEFRFAPDLWYNDVDGIRLGIRTRGQFKGTFDDGPHRLDVGLWLGTWFPDMPVSYYLRYTNPIDAISDFNSEGSYGLISSYRAGFHQHGLRIDKRWQPGFNEDEFSELYAFSGFYQHVDTEYVAFPSIWQTEPIYYLNAGFEHQLLTQTGVWNWKANFWTGTAGDEDFFATFHAQMSKNLIISRSFGIRMRVAAGAVSNDAPAEQRFQLSNAPGIDWMKSGFFRAKGTIPMPWLDRGLFQFTGNGPALRGFNRTDIVNAQSGAPGLKGYFTALNVEADYPNPLDLLFEQIPVVGDFLRLRSYLFLDAARVEFSNNKSEILSNAGPGLALTLNIPDQIGKPRGFIVRYDVPLYVSSPSDNRDAFRYRSLFSLGAVIGF
ncbi:MAG: hypothetical protein LAT67_07770 [Balneolales bacterium]|nr:hypothetical protein [Balneolales bacterium]